MSAAQNRFSRAPTGSARIGPARAIAVTFLMPAFAMFRGWLILAEPVSAALLVCAGAIVCGTALSSAILRPQ